MNNHCPVFKWSFVCIDKLFAMKNWAEHFYFDMYMANFFQESVKQGGFVKDTLEKQDDPSAESMYK